MRTKAKTPEAPLAYRVPEFCRRVGICASTFWKYSAMGRIKTVRLGHRVVVPADEVEKILREGFEK
jgi:predicted site-specific integrase-resolvase